uniref:Uncharacterized protein n=1 Tax=Spongospora subterranea TaxID=70186 RepID=A0A0H5QUW4_9EUKA|eukprot:CRZ05341.1 hypothetical protein [Spongospora subterranea]
METLPVNMDSPPTDPISAPDMEIIGPISAQVLSTIDQVKQHTDDMKRNIQRRSSLTSKAGEPTRKPLHPMAHLPPLFYPGSSYSRMYDQKKEADVATATVSESVPTAGKTSKVSEQKKEETKETPKTKPKMKQQALKIKAEVKGGGKRETGYSNPIRIWVCANSRCVEKPSEKKQKL